MRNRSSRLGSNSGRSEGLVLRSLVYVEPSAAINEIRQAGARLVLASAMIN